MITTLDIDDDVLGAVEALAKLEHKTTGQVLSELVRQALTRSSGAHNLMQEEEFLGISPLPPRCVVVTSELIESLRESDTI